MERLVGSSVYEGIALGEIVYLINDLKSNGITMVSIEKEIKKLNKVVNYTINELEELKHSLSNRTNNMYLEMLDVHIMLLKDNNFLNDIKISIRDNCVSLEDSIRSVIEKYRVIFNRLQSISHQNKFFEVKDVSHRLLSNISESGLSKSRFHNKILVTKSLDSSLLLECKSKGIDILGVITGSHGASSHAAILTRSFKIPTIFNVKGLNKVNWNEIKRVILDSRKGNENLLLNPDLETEKNYNRLCKDFDLRRKNIKEYELLDPITRCGKEITVDLNISFLEELFESNSSSNIGLFRTEFLFMSSSKLLDEDIQFKMYSDLAATVKEGKSVNIRVLDWGSDKSIKYLPLVKELNPALGNRGIRYLLQKDNILRVQFKAILRASKYFKINVMYPMIYSFSEVIKANEILEECKLELLSRSIDIPKSINIGAMIEVPSAALNIDKILDHVDFVSIGTNDLTQYILAADRQNKSVSHIYNSLDSSVLKIVKYVTQQAKKRGKLVNVCGELPSTPAGLIALLSMGLDSVSITPSFAGMARKIIRSIRIEDLKVISEYILESSDAEKNKNMINMFLDEVLL